METIPDRDGEARRSNCSLWPARRESRWPQRRRLQGESTTCGNGSPFGPETGRRAGALIALPTVRPRRRIANEPTRCRFSVKGSGKTASFAEGWTECLSTIHPCPHVNPAANPRRGSRPSRACLPKLRAARSSPAAQQSRSSAITGVSQRSRSPAPWCCAQSRCFACSRLSVSRRSWYTKRSRGNSSRKRSMIAHSARIRRPSPTPSTTGPAT
ncbi:hypothetical protein GALL_442520 [mine drainage metagenome]|uniref:Uncharacterized protein n=1 Tax=mine drainage metagenome TaxID=410659 RepID=A0A1J5QDS9_9ZZZZ